jgi:hypothetical protein
VLYRSGYVKVIEVASRTDDFLRLEARHRAKQLIENLDGRTVINEWALRFDRWFGN